MGVLVRMAMLRARDTYLRLRSSCPSLASTTARSRSLSIRALAMFLISLLEILFLAIVRPSTPMQQMYQYEIGFAANRVLDDGMSPAGDVAAPSPSSPIDPDGSG